MQFKFLIGLIIAILTTQNYQAQTDTINSILQNCDNDSVRINKLYHWAFNLSKNQPEKAILLSKQAIQLAEKYNNSLKSACLTSLALGYYYKGDYTTALKYNLGALSNSEKYNDNKQSSIILNHMGMIYDDINQYKKSIEYYKMALDKMIAENDQKGIASIYNNIGLGFSNLKMQDSALFYFDKSYSVNSKIDNPEALAMILNNMASIYFDKKDFKTCVNYDTKALEIRKKLNNKFQIASSLNNLGYDYLQLNNTQKAISLHDQALQLGREISAKEIVLAAYDGLINAYLHSNNYKLAYYYSEKYNVIKDSIYNETSSRQLNEMSVRFETDKKEYDNRLLHQQNEISAKTIKQQNIISSFIVLFLIIVSGFLIYAIRAYKQKQKANEIIFLQKKDVEIKNHIIEEKQKEILDSIYYAKRIQYTLLAHKDFLMQNIPQHFVLFNPKDIVSGDFYWAAKKNSKFYLAVCDSTGHGVPGAFMSLLNISFLNEAVNEKNIEQPNEVFNFVRQRLIDNISRDGQRDGFDGILICLDSNTNKITYAAANNSPILIKNNSFVSLDSDRMPVGIGERMVGFTLYTINAEKGDNLYLYTDGFADQFGGPRGKKFKYKQLNELLVSISSQTLEEQKTVLTDVFETWRGNLEQVDDVCVIGIKI